MHRGKRISRLIRLYLKGRATIEEKKEIEDWYALWGSKTLRFLEGDPQKIEESAQKNLELIKKRLKEIDKYNHGKRKISNKNVWMNSNWKQLSAAAIILGIILGLYSLRGQLFKKTTSKNIAEAARTDFQPAKNKAVLILANGDQITLDSTQKGLITKVGNTNVVQLSNGRLVYQQDSNSDKIAKPIFNEVITPRGGVYELILPDGSLAYLNTASSIRFPTSFVGNDREVEISGEVYFEITPDKKKPFKVRVGEITIQVLGTHFDVMAYPDAKVIRTTLLEGSVRVNANGTSKVIKPGEAIDYSNNQLKVIEDPNIEKIMAWRNQLFWFDHDDIYTVASELSRWYNIDISVQGNITDLFTGSIPRNLSFAKVFDILQKTGAIHYHVLGENRIVLSP